MISFIHHSEEPLFDTTAIANQIVTAHAEFTENALINALVKKFGTLPSVTEISKHCKCCIEDETGVHHYVWFEEPPEIGDHIDTGEILCSIAPPKLYTQEN